MVIPIRSRSPEIMIPNQMIADHQYPVLLEVIYRFGMGFTRF